MNNITILIVSSIAVSINQQTNFHHNQNQPSLLWYRFFLEDRPLAHNYDFYQQQRRLRLYREKKMARSGNDDVGRLIMANATPFLWKRSAKKNKGMSAWAFPERVTPGETVTVAIAFKGGDGADGRASYQVSEITTAV